MRVGVAHAEIGRAGEPGARGLVADHRFRAQYVGVDGAPPGIVAVGEGVEPVALHPALSQVIVAEEGNEEPAAEVVVVFVELARSGSTGGRRRARQPQR